MTLIPNETRRGFLGLIAGGAAFAIARPGLAQTPASAQAMIQKTVAEVYAVINSGLPEPAMYGKFTAVFARNADVAVIARSCLGPAARQVGATELADFTDAFTGYIGRKYGRRFKQFIGGRIEVGAAAPLKSFVVVKSTAYLNGQEPIAIDWHVSDKSGQVKFFNLIVEGVNMLSTERAEIAALLARRKGDVAALAADLRKAG